MPNDKHGPGLRPIARREKAREPRPLTVLDHEVPYSRSAHAHAVASRSFVDWKAVTTQLARVRFHREPQATVESLGEIVIIRDDGSLTLQNGELNYVAVWDLVRRTYGDEFDFLTFFTDFSVPFGYSFWSAIYFNTEGISPYGLPYDVRSQWSTERLQGFHFINPGHVNLMGVYLQEFGTSGVLTFTLRTPPTLSSSLPIFSWITNPDTGTFSWTTDILR